MQPVQIRKPPEQLTDRQFLNALTTDEYNTLYRLAAAKLSRECEAIRLFEPLPHQQLFFKSLAKRLLVAGGNRCLSGDERIWDPVARMWRRVDGIESDFYVLSLNPETGLLETKRASRPFIKGHGQLVEAKLRSGRSVKVTAEHRVLNQKGHWVSVAQAYACRERLLGFSSFHPRSTCGKRHPSSTSCRRSTSCEQVQCQLESLLFEASHPPRFEVSGSTDEDIIVDLVPIGQGPIWDFSVDGNANYWHNGIISANSGKTTCAAIDIAMALTGQHPFKPYRKTGGIIIAAAQDGKNIANTMWKKLSAPGQFQIIRDELTNKWRSIRPWQEYDVAYKEKWKDAPPILPPRFFDVNRDVAWEDRKAGVPAKIVIPQTKWEIHFYSGNAMPPKGMIADIGWFDEEFQNAKAWLDEIYARLVDREGCLIWSATPQTATYALIDLHNECMKDLTKPEEKRTYGFFPMVIADNPFMTEDQKEQFYRDASQNKETYDARVHGKFIELSNKVFPEYDRDSQHHVKPFPIPWDWTVYVSIDPGYNPWAAVLAAIPPPEERYAIYIFDEIYESQCDSAKFAKVLSEKLAKHNVLPQAYIIDSHSARQTSYVSGKTGLEQIYEDLKAENSLAIQKGWVYGQTDVAARVNRARHYMRIDTDQKPRLFVFRGLNWFEWEIERYTNVQKARDGTYAPRDKDNHLMDAVSYLCAYDPKWVEKKVRRRKTSFMDWINKLSREIHGPQEASDQTTYFS